MPYTGPPESVMRQIRLRKRAGEPSQWPVSNKSFIKHLNDNTGIPIRTLRMILLAMANFTQEQLAQGHRVNIWGMGTFFTKVRTGRVHTKERVTTGRGGHIKVIPPHTQEDNFQVKFEPSFVLKAWVQQRKPVK